MSYTSKIKALNALADDSMLGVRLGRFCISTAMPVVEVAAELDVSKTVVYNWFTGRRDVGKHLRQKVEGYYNRLQCAESL